MKFDDRASFYDHVREHLGALNQSQVDGFENLLNAFELSTVIETKWFSYMLATAWHETWRTMHPICEMGGARYLQSKPYYPFYGRGYVQLTWEVNYKRYGISDHPDSALDPKIAAHVLIDGMDKGIFTGKKLGDYFAKTKSDPINARRIINGLDKAADIAKYFNVFDLALNSAITAAA